MLYIIPFFPFVTRSIVIFIFRRQMRNKLSEAESDRESHRSVILALAGFSFTGVLGLAVVNATLKHDLRLSIYYLLVSFLSYLFVLNLQGYKYNRWHDQVGNAVMESASLALLLSIVAIVFSLSTSIIYQVGLTIMTVAVWLVDHSIRLYLSIKYLREKS